MFLKFNILADSTVRTVNNKVVVKALAVSKIHSARLK